MNEKYFAGMDLRRSSGALCIYNSKSNRIVVMAETRDSILFWLMVCKHFHIRVLCEISE